MLAAHGAVIIDADLIAREVMQSGSDGYLRVVEAFPEAVENKVLNRKLLGEIIFNDQEKRNRLNGIIHPLVIAQIKAEGELLAKEKKVVFADIPLLYETQSQEWLQAVVVVYLPENLQLMRLMKRDNLSEAQALARIKAQMSIEEKRQLADYLIDNSGSLQETQKQVDRLWYQIIK